MFRESTMFRGVFSFTSVTEVSLCKESTYFSYLRGGAGERGILTYLLCGDTVRV